MVLRQKNQRVISINTVIFKYLHFSQRFPSLTSPPPTREWKEIGVHPELCVGTVRRALSKVSDTLSNELDSLKKEGKVKHRQIRITGMNRASHLNCK